MSKWELFLIQGDDSTPFHCTKLVSLQQNRLKREKYRCAGNANKENTPG
jgi:hypothetical protein